MRERIPFAPSAGRLRSILAGDHTIPVDEMRRVRIKDDRLLSVPVEGGASALRSIDPRISQHGRWQAVHLGALNAAYGKTPFFPHIFPEIERIYRETGHGDLHVFNRSLLEIALQWTGADDLRSEISEFRQRYPKRYEELKKEIETKVNYNLSIFDALFRLGKDTVFAMV